MNKIIALIMLIISIGYGGSVNAASCVSQGLSNGLIAHYKFSNNANDELQLSNGTASDVTSTEDRICSVNEAFSFNGVTSRIEAFNPSPSLNVGSQSLTISAWVNTIIYVPDITVVVERYESGLYCCSSPGLYGLLISPAGKPYFRIRNDVGVWFELVAQTFIRDGKWHHIAGVLDRSANKLKIYIDGVLDTSVAAENVGVITTSNSPLTIGRSTRSGGQSPQNYFNGMIDDVRLYNRAISDCEARELYYKD